MMTAAPSREILSFGPFRLIASERLLTKDGAPVELSARAFDILATLLSSPTKVVSKGDLMAQVWPGVKVEEGSLRFHVANLRKTLGDGKDGARYITTASGRGYCFVAPVSRSSDQESNGRSVEAVFRHANLPSRLAGMIDREDDLEILSARLYADRFVTIVGSGGVGKTTLAIAIGHQLTGAFAGAVLFVDLSMLSDPDLVPTVVASMLGLSVQSSDATPNLINYLRDKRILLILDTCEHLVEAIAALASRIFRETPQVHILATSRETLQVEGEQVYRLEPLACPPEDAVLTAAIAQTFPATQLFVERAVASGARLDFSDAEAAIVVSICRKLDGVALAIELAARRVESYGLQQTAALLGQRLTLLWLGSRTAPPRHKTLQATLDWSYGLLSDLERVVLRRLAVFVGHFTLDAALAVAASATIDRTHIFNAIDSLVAKSMVATRPIGAMMRYRLLDTTRAYVLETSVDDAGLADLAPRYANYYRQWLEQSGVEWPTLSTGAERAPHFAGVNNVRAALEWCFGADGDAEIGIGLASAAAPVFLAMSLLTECHRWSERAISSLAIEAREGLEEMRLQAALGVSLMFTRGGSAAAHAALNKSLAIAEQCGGALDQVEVLGPLVLFNLRTGDFREALHCAMRCSALAGSTVDSVARPLAHCVLGISLHLGGDLGGARAELEAALPNGSRSQPTTTVYLGFEGRILAGAILARNLWLQGYPAEAVQRARQTITDAAAMEHSLTLSIALIWAISLFLWTGDLDSVEADVDWLISRSQSHSLAPYLVVGRGFSAELAIRRGDAKAGVENLQGCLEKLHAMPYELVSTPLCISLVQGLAALGRYDDGMALVEATMRRVESSGDSLYMPELLRVKAGLLRSQPEPALADAELQLERSLQLSRGQGARAWELRAAMDLAALLADRGQRAQGKTLLQNVFGQFTEGFDTADLRAAKSLLDFAD